MCQKKRNELTWYDFLIDWFCLRELRENNGHNLQKEMARRNLKFFTQTSGGRAVLLQDMTRFATIDQKYEVDICICKNSQ